MKFHPVRERGIDREKREGDILSHGVKANYGEEMNLCLSIFL
jgi:hypothetical protein